MRSAGTYGALLPTLILFGACSSTPVPLSVAVAEIERDFQSVGTVSLSAAASGDPSDEAIFEHKVRQAQCYYGQSNPIIPATVKDFSLALAGTFTDTGKLTGGTITAVPTVGAEFDVAHGQTQTVTLPVTFAPLSDLPRVYLAQQVSYLSGLTSDKPDPKNPAPQNVTDFKAKEMTDIIDRTNRLGGYVEHLRNSFAAYSVTCPKSGTKPPDPFQQIIY